MKKAITDMFDMHNVEHKGGSDAIKSYIGLMAAVVVSLGPEMAELHSWAELTQPAAIGEHLHVLGGAILGWLSPSPLRRHAK